jgi:TP901 family phage tail tape measure protein
MTNEKDQIDILLNYKSNFEKASKNLNEFLMSTESRIASTENRLAELLNKKGKSSRALIDNGKQELDILYRQKQALTEQLRIQSKLGGQSDAMHQMLKSNVDNEIAWRKDSNKAFTSQLKSRISGELQEEKSAFKDKVSMFNGLLKESQATNSKRLADERATSKASRLIQQQETIAKVRQQEKMTADAKKAEARSWKGAWFGSDSGSTFGHKFLTTAQYAAAGTAIFASAQAVVALGTAALEADLNMRTMAAVLRLNITEAMALDSQVRKLGETYGGTTGEIEQVAIALGRAGIASKDITKATEVTLAMARLTGDTFEQSASAVISYQQVFGNTTSIQTLGDKLAYIANVSRLSTQDIGTFSNYALAAAKDVGLTEDAVGGLAAAFSNAGVNASTIGTQIRRFTTLLTDDSEAVTNFYRTLGINQKNLLMDLQKGGATSNEALLGFVKQLKTVDKATFTNLTGQMDILAANSLQLMRNNTENIDKFVRDLQTGMSGQLDSTKIILNSFIVTYEGMWNSLKNIAADGLQGLTDDFTQISRLFDLIGGNEQKSALKGLALQQQKEDAALAIHREAFSRGKISIEKLDEYEQWFMSRRVAREDAAKGITKQNSDYTLRTKAEEIAALDKMIEGTENILFDEKSTKVQIDVAKRRNDELIAKKKELVGVIKEEAKASVAATDSVSIADNVKAVNTLIDAKQDYSALENLINKQVSNNREKNRIEIQKQADALKGNADIYTEISQIISSSKTPYDLLTNSASKYEDVVQNIRGLQKDNESGKNDAEINRLVQYKNAIAEIQGINSKSIQDETTLLNLANKKTATTKQGVSTAERAQRKVETEAEKLRKYDEAKSQHLTSIAELDRQINQEGDISLSKAESTFRLDTQLLGLAYERYTIAKGTTGEKAAELTYLASHEKYLKSSVTYITKQTAEEEKRKSLQVDLNSGLEQAIEGEQVRLGIIEKSTDSEYEKLRVKIEQGKIDGLLFGDELARQEARLAQLDTLQRKKKDTNTLAMEYQRELADQETVGYMTAKAGLASLEDGMMTFFDVTSDGWLDWHSLVSSVLTDIYKQLLQQLVVKQLVSGIAGGLSGAFNNVSTASTYGTNVGSQQTATLQAQDAGLRFAKGGMIPSKGYASGGVLSGGTGIRDDIYLGNVGGTQMFAMGGEFITRKDSVNQDTKGTLDYINKTGQVPSGGGVNVPVSINIENQTGQAISADMISQMTKTNDSGDYEKVVNIVLKASQVDPRMRSLMKGGR